MRTNTWIAAVVTTLMAAAGCKSTPRTDLTREGISIKALKGWKQTRHKQTAVFHDPASHATIAIRAVAFEDDVAGTRNLEQVIDATRTALRALPRAKLRRSKPLARELFDARVFELSYVPPGKKRRYERRHAVLIGEYAIYHVWLTAPAGQLERRTKLFDDVLDSLREEV